MDAKLKTKVIIILIIFTLLFVAVFPPYDKTCHPKPVKVIECREGFYCISRVKVNFLCDHIDDFIPLEKHTTI